MIKTKKPSYSGHVLSKFLQSVRYDTYIISLYRDVLSSLFSNSFFVFTQRDQAKCHYGDVIMGAIASEITSLTIVYSTVYSDADQRKHQSSVPLAFVWGIHR